MATADASLHHFSFEVGCDCPQIVQAIEAWSTVKMSSLDSDEDLSEQGVSCKEYDFQIDAEVSGSQIPFYFPPRMVGPMSAFGYIDHVGVMRMCCA